MYNTATSDYFPIFSPSFNTGDSVSISGTATVEARGNGSAISSSGNITVKSMGTGHTVIAIGENSVVRISGGDIYNNSTSNTDSAIFTPINNTGDTIFISDTAKVEIKGAGNAIRSNGNIYISGGIVRAKGNSVIYASDTNVTVTISGGVVFAYSDEIVGNNKAIHMLANFEDVFEGFIGTTGEGMVIAWE